MRSYLEQEVAGVRGPEVQAQVIRHAVEKARQTLVGNMATPGNPDGAIEDLLDIVAALLVLIEKRP